MNAEFNWWLLIVGLGAGAAITWLVLSDLARRDDELADRERADEAVWIADELARTGTPVSTETIERLLQAHRQYLRRDADPMDEVPEDAFEIDDGALATGPTEARAEPQPETRPESRPETRQDTRQDPRPEVPDPT